MFFSVCPNGKDKIKPQPHICLVEKQFHSEKLHNVEVQQSQFPFHADLKHSCSSRSENT